MRKLWIGCLILGMTTPTTWAAEEAQQVPARQIQSRHGKAIYLGARLEGMGPREAGRPKAATATGDIDFYNVWTSFFDIDINNDLSLDGHAYVMCSNIDDSIFYGHLIYSFEDFLEVRVRYDWSKADRLTATTFFNLNGGPGFFLLVDEFDIDSFRDGYYKVVAKYAVTGGGNGSGKETCYFDVLTCN